MVHSASSREKEEGESEDWKGSSSDAMREESAVVMACVASWRPLTSSLPGGSVAASLSSLFTTTSGTTKLPVPAEEAITCRSSCTVRSDTPSTTSMSSTAAPVRERHVVTSAEKSRCPGESNSWKYSGAAPGPSAGPGSGG